ncbi:MAG: amidohydrolase family protein [Pirellulaceae bacterium]
MQRMKFLSPVKLRFESLSGCATRLVCGLTVLVTCLQPCLADTHAYFAATIWTGENGAEATIQDGMLLVVDGKVKAVGARGSIDLPAVAKRHELGKVTLIPGLVIAESNLVRSSRSAETAVNPQVRAIDGFDAFDDFDELLAAGITTVQISPAANRLIPGVTGVVRLGAEPGEHVLSPEEGLAVVLTSAGLSPPTVYEPPVGAVSVDRPVEPTRPQLASSLSQAIFGLDLLLDEAKLGGDGDSETAYLANAISRGVSFRWYADSNAAVAGALRLSKAFELPWVVVDPQRIDLLIASELWKDNALARGVLLTPEFEAGRITNPPVSDSSRDDPLPVWTRAKLLTEAGIGNRLAIHATTDGDLKNILHTAAVFGRAGLSREAILRMLTANPAAMMQLQGQVGTLVPGAYADFVAVSGTPLRPGSSVQATYADGELVYDSSQASKGRDSVARVIRAAKIYTPDGVQENVQISVADGKISGIGASTSSGQKTLEYDFGNAVIVPGWIDCATTVGIGGSLADQVSLGTKLGELLARDDPQIAVARKGGVTTVLLGSSRLPSPVIAFKLSDQPTAIADPVAVRWEMKGNLTSAEESFRKTLASGKKYADTWVKYEDDLKDYKKALDEYETAKKKFDAAKKAAEEKKQAKAGKSESKDSKSGDSPKPDSGDAKENTGKDKDPAKDAETKGKADADRKKTPDGKAAKPDGDEKDTESKSSVEKEGEAKKADPNEPKKPSEPKKPKASESLEPYRALFAKEIPAIVRTADVSAVPIIVKLFRDEFDLRLALEASSAAVEHAELLREKSVVVLVGPRLVGSKQGTTVSYPAELSVSRVPFAFESRATTGVSELPMAVAHAVFAGLGVDDALNGLTTTPSTFFGLDAIAALEPGKDADLVVLSGPPLELGSEVLAVMIDGEWVYERNKP